MSEQSQICPFYDGTKVLITGGTGFVGKILIEKLLRSTNVGAIYVLIREKKGYNAHSRLDQLFDSVIFDELKKQRPKFRHHVVAVAGDVSITGLGLTISDRQTLISEVDVVFHVAATVRFDEHLKLSYDINVRGTADVLELSRQMKNLKSLVHVSTAYSNCHLNTIEECFYGAAPDYEKIGSLLDKVSKGEAEKLTSRLIRPWPNTYTFTKALAESLIRETGANLPIGIFRPSIVISTYKEPVASWTDNLYGPTGAVAGAGSGLLRLLHCDQDVVADVVPVDTCVAGIIAVAWDVANRKTENIPIYNYVSSVENSVTWAEYIFLSKFYGEKFPLHKAIWTIKMSSVKSRLLYVFLRFVLHLLPAILVDTVAFFTGQKPQLLSMYAKIHKFSNVTEFFCLREWSFCNDNVLALWAKMNHTDRDLFPLSITTVHWTKYFKNYFKGVRVYLLGDPISTLEEARTRKKWFDVAHNVITLLGIFILVMLVWKVVVRVFQCCQQ